MDKLNSEKWDMDGDAPKADRLLEYGVTITSPFQIVMRLDYATSKEHLDGIRKGKRAPRRLQVACNPADAAKIADLLMQYSTRAKALADAGGSKG